MTILPDGRELWHTPSPDMPQDALNRLTTFWSSATKELLIVDYSFNLATILPIIQSHVQAGRRVTLVLDRSQSKGPSETALIASLEALVKANTSLVTMVIGTSSMHQIIHDKFSVVDQAHAEYGSFNYTATAAKEDNFFFIESNSPVVPSLLSIANSILTWITENEPTGIINLVQ